MSSRHRSRRWGLGGAARLAMTQVFSMALVLATSMLAGAILAQPAVNGPSRETLLFSLPPGWKPVFSEQGDTQQRALFVPDDQGKEDWKDMWAVTMARGGGAPDLGTTVQRASQDYEDACNAHTASKPQTDSSKGYLTAFWTMGCQRRRNEPTGEASFFLFLDGREGVYLVQRIWRLPPFGREGPPIFPQQRDAAIDVLKTIRLCDPATDPGGCRPGRGNP